MLVTREQLLKLCLSKSQNLGMGGGGRLGTQSMRSYLRYNEDMASKHDQCAAPASKQICAAWLVLVTDSYDRNLDGVALTLNRLVAHQSQYRCRQEYTQRAQRGQHHPSMYSLE